MRLCGFGCLGGPPVDEEPKASLQRQQEVQQHQSDETTGKTLELQARLISLDGTWLSRLGGLVRAFESHGLVARLYGLSQPNERALLEFILMPGSVRTGALVDDEAEMLAQMYETQGPVSRILPMSTNEVSRQKNLAPAIPPHPRAVAVLPILQTGKLVGALWLATLHPAPPPSNSHPSQPQPPIASTTSQSQSRSIDDGDDDPTDETTAAASLHTMPYYNTSSKNAAAAATSCFHLLNSPASLKQLSLAASMCLADSAPLSLHWLASTSWRLQSAPSTLTLTTHLAAAVTAHVRARFVVETQPTTVLVPPGREASVALLFRTQPPLPPPSTTASLTSSVTPSSNLRPAAQRPLTQSGAQTAPTPSGPPDIPIHSPSTQMMTPLPLLATSSSIQSYGSSLHRLLVPLPAAETASTASLGSTATATTTTTIATTTTTAPGVGGAVLPSPSAALHASAFPLTNTLLQAVLNARRQQPAESGTTKRQPALQYDNTRLALRGAAAGERQVGGLVAAAAGGGGGGPPLASTAAPATTLGVVEDVMRFVQNVHNPSRDVYMLCGLRWGSLSGSAGMGVGGCGSSGGGGSGSGSMGVPIAPKSLVLLTLGLGDGGWLAMYLTFGRRLPGPLLEAVRDACQELLDKALSQPAREHLRGPLAAEYDTLKAAAPGSYAVVRRNSNSGDFSTPATTTTGAGGALMSSSGGAPAGGGGISSASAAGAGGGGFLPAAVDLSDQTQQSGAAGGVGGSGGPTIEAVKAAYSSRRGSSLDSAEVQPSPLRPRVPALLSHTRSTPSTSNPTSTTTSIRLQPLRPQAAGSQRSSQDTAEISSPGCNAYMNAVAANGASAVGRGVPSQINSGGGNNNTNSNTTNNGGSGGSHNLLCRPMDDTTASIILVQGPESDTTSIRQRMDLLVESIQSTINTAVAAAAATGSFPSDLDQLELQEVLGRGSGGVVFRGLMSGSLPVAVKLMEVPDEDLMGASEAATGGPAAATRVVVRLRQEVLRNATELAVQSSLSHPNIVQFYSTFTNVALRLLNDKGNPDDGGSGGKGRYLLDCDPQLLCLTSSPPLLPVTADEAPPEELRVTCIVSEFCDGGCLGTALYRKNFPKQVPQQQQQQQPGSGGADGGADGAVWDMKGVYMTLLDVALALRHLHSMHLVHRDIKPANLLLKSNPRDHRGFTVKLADFGFVLHLTEEAEDGTRYTHAEQACGTVSHMAPECMVPKSKIGTPADIFSFGILMWELLAGGLRPYPTVRPDKIPGLVYRGARPSFGPNTPLTYQALAHACWSTAPAQRPRATDLVALITSLIQSM